MQYPSGAVFGQNDFMLCDYHHYWAQLLGTEIRSIGLVSVDGGNGGSSKLLGFSSVESSE